MDLSFLFLILLHNNKIQMKKQSKFRIEKLPIFGLLLTLGFSKLHSGWHLDMIAHSAHTPLPKLVSTIHSPLRYILLKPWQITVNLKMLMNKVNNYEETEKRILEKKLLREIESLV